MNYTAEQIMALIDEAGCRARAKAINEALKATEGWPSECQSAAADDKTRLALQVMYGDLRRRIENLL